MRSLGYYWWALRRDWRRGWRTSWAAHRVAPRIWHWRNPHAGAPTVSTPVHLLCGTEHVDLAAWMIASWVTQTGRNWRFVLHDDGSLPATTAGRLAALGLQVNVVGGAEAEARVAPSLASRPACAAYRQQHPLARKVFDAPLLADGQRFILLDTDVLFFAPPAEMTTWADREDDRSCWFNADCAEASTVTASDAKSLLGVSLWPRVNSGVCLLAPEAIDLDFCERVLRETSILAGHVWRVEQTLLALCASRHGRGGILPPTYEVTLARDRSPGVIARHYVGAVRDRFWGEGVAQLAPSLLRK